MNWIYLSPHADDVALSCGGLVWEQTQAGYDVSVWTICAGDPPAGPLSPFAAALHARWETGRDAAEQRRIEDRASCTVMGASYHQFDIPDCIYRHAEIRSQIGDSPRRPDFLYTTEESLFGDLHPAESALVDDLSKELVRLLPAKVELVCPLALGGHVDHQLTRAAAGRLGKTLWYYADYPYVLGEDFELNHLHHIGWNVTRTPISAAGLKAWQQAIAAHKSQISTFWPDLNAMRDEIRAFSDDFGGGVLWRPPDNTRSGMSYIELAFR